MKEADFSKLFISELKKIYPDNWIAKISGSDHQMIGIPDYLCCINGKFIGIEFKIQRSKKISITPSQVLNLNKIIKANGEGLIIACDEETGEISIRNVYTNPKIAMEKQISLSWNYVFFNIREAIDFISSKLGSFSW